MATDTIDTPETVRQFVAAGIETEQAKLIVAAISHSGGRIIERVSVRFLEVGRDRRGSHTRCLPRSSWMVVRRGPGDRAATDRAGRRCARCCATQPDR